jgi:uncharacterized protein YjiS (DUF1127 family)
MNSLNDESRPALPAARSFFGQLVSWRQRSRAAAQLKDLPDAQLRDIGIERRDVDTLVYCHLNRFRSWSARF